MPQRGAGPTDAEKDDALIVIASDYGDHRQRRRARCAEQFGMPENVRALRQAIIPDLASQRASAQAQLAQQGVRACPSAAGRGPLAG